LDHLAALYRGEGQRVDFLYVYLTGGAGGGRPTGAPSGHAPDVGPEETRRRVRELPGPRKLPFPCAFDDDGRVARAYGAWPQRLVVIGADGRVAYDAGEGLLPWDMAEVRRHLEGALLYAGQTPLRAECGRPSRPSGENGSS
jgi:hypothetical protein